MGGIPCFEKWDSSLVPRFGMTAINDDEKTLRSKKGRPYEGFKPS